MKCQYCDNELPQGVTKCPYCGAACPQNAYTPAPAPTPVAGVQPQVIIQNAQPQVVYATGQKSRVTYILLAVFLGCLGIHNFYAGRTGSGIAQLLITAVSLGGAAPLAGIWALIEIFVVKKDGKNVPFAAS